MATTLTTNSQSDGCILCGNQVGALPPTVILRFGVQKTWLCSTNTQSCHHSAALMATRQHFDLSWPSSYRYEVEHRYDSEPIVVK